MEELTLKQGHKVDGRWEVIRMLGEGSFGAVYEVVDGQGLLEGHMALKLESAGQTTQLLKIEVAVLKMLQGNERICTVYACGKNNKFNFMLMSMLGPNVSQLRRKAPKRMFSFSTTTRVTFHSLKAIQSVHEAGWLHRDIKPSNFAIGTGDKISSIFIFDFGLCRKWKTDDAIREPRNKAGFRGTLRYCSVNAHKKVELGRHDDLISLLYMMVEMVKGDLPWKSSNDTNEVFRLKKASETTLYAKLPKAIIRIHQHLHELQYKESPQYSLFEQVLLEIVYTMGYHKQSLDWEKRLQQETAKQEENKTGAVQASKDKATVQDVLAKLDNVVDAEDEVEELPISGYTEPQQPV